MHAAAAFDRQVEVACVERGHALAYAYNCSMSAAEAVLGELRSQNQHLLGINSQLAAGQEALAKELKAVDFLRCVTHRPSLHLHPSKASPSSMVLGFVEHQRC